MPEKVIINTILNKVEELNKKRKVKGEKPYSFGPVLSEKEVRTFEETYEINLPIEFRNFLLQVGNGNNVECISNSLQYKLDTLNCISGDYNDVVDPANYKKPFPFGNNEEKEIIFRNHYYRRYPWLYVETIHPNEYEINGCIILNYAGWSTSHTALVVSGEQKGNIWYVGDGFIPFYSDITLKCFTFLEWINDFLDGLLNPIEEQLLTAPENIKSLTWIPEKLKEKICWEELLKCENLENINLTNLDIAPNWEDFNQLEHLKKLMIGNSANKKELSIEKIPESLRNCKQLEILEINYNSLKKIPDWISDFDHLKTLNLYWNPGLKYFPDIKDNLSNLVYLNIGRTGLSTEKEIEVARYFQSNKRCWFSGNKYFFILENQALPGSIGLSINDQKDFKFMEIFKLDELTHLCLTINREDIKLPEKINTLEKLQSLSIEKELPTNLKKCLSSFTQLKKLDFPGLYQLKTKDAISIWASNKNITDVILYINNEIPSEIEKLSHIKILTLQINHSNQVIFPETIEKLKLLKSLTIIQAKEILFPPNISKLRNLEYINIEEVEKLHFPESFKQLNLETLRVKFTAGEIDNSIKEFSKLPAKLIDLDIEAPQLAGKGFFANIRHCTELNFLNVSTREISAEIGDLTNLKTLTIFNCEDAQVNHDKPLVIHHNICLLQKLEEIDLQENHLQEIPESLCYLHQLKILIIDNNNLSAIPENFGQLVNLKELNLGFNQFKKFPKEIITLQNLEILDLSKNQLFTLPESVGQLQKLKIIYVHNNKIKVLPKSLANIEKLNTLTVDKEVGLSEELIAKSFLQINYM